MADWRSEMRTAPYLFHLEVSGGARVFHLVQQVLLDARVLMTLLYFISHFSTRSHTYMLATRFQARPRPRHPKRSPTKSNT